MMNREFTSLLRKLQSPNCFEQSTALKALAASIQEAKSSDIEELLEVLISTHDVEIQMKLLSILASYLINNGIHYRVVVKYYPLYDAIQNILVRGLPVKAVSGLNFIVALLYCVDGDERGVATQARNMLRLSGCLNAMADMFSSSMMYQDTWAALCQSLAEACSGCEVNQSYCSHLVPLCVQRCRQGNVHMCAVLQSLLHNHDRNIQLFVESQGPTIFTRQALQYNMCMQLLSTVVARSAAAVEVLRNTDVVFHLKDFLHLYGPYSQMGQWSTIILFHFNRREGSVANVTTNVLREPNSNERNENKTNSGIIDLDHTRNDRTKYSTPNSVTKDLNSTKKHLKSNRSDSKRNDTFRTATKSVQNVQENPEDTANLLQNVIKEVIYWKSREQMKTMKPPTSTQHLNPKPKQNLSNVMKFQNIPKIPSTYRETQDKDLTFSFLAKENRQYNDKQSDFYPNNKIRTLSYLTDSDKVPSNDTKRYLECDARVGSNENDYYSRRNNQSAVLLTDFNPPFKSTPKRRKKTNDIKQKAHEKEPSFSFLVQQSHQYPKKQPDFYQNDQLIESFMTDNDEVPRNATKRYTETDAFERSDASDFYAQRNYDHNDVLLKEFNPPFKSTPRHRGKTDNTKVSSRRSLHSRKFSRNFTKVSKTSQTENATITKQNNTLNPTTDIKHASMSARLFNAINESCTTFVKSVKSIFRTKNDNKVNDKTLTYEKNNCSFSFTNYMRKRDELLKEYSNNESVSGTYKVDSCKTCKDTIILQQKMVRDDDLKLTVKKLKKGINLYGCDFKKISKAFWPRDKYMTPEMLYNLYRKLIVKGGHGNHEFRQKAFSMIRTK